MSKKSRERTPELEEIAAQLGSMNTQELNLSPIYLSSLY